MFKEKDHRGRKIIFRGLRMAYLSEIAIIKRDNDYIIALGYNSKTGTWGQGIYDITTIEQAFTHIFKKNLFNRYYLNLKGRD